MVKIDGWCSPGISPIFEMDNGDIYSIEMFSRDSEWGVEYKGVAYEGLYFSGSGVGDFEGDFKRTIDSALYDLFNCIENN